jgi:HEAT repeat protein
MKRLSLPCLVVLLSSALPAQAYLDAAPTLGRVLNEASHVAVLQVEKVSVDKRAIIFKKVADLRGTSPEQFKHQIADGSHPREPKLVLDWAEEAQADGQLALCFHNGKAARICLGHYWYECTAGEAPWWHMTRGAPELGMAYCGSTAKLREHVAAILAGKEAIITAVKHDLHDGAAFGPVIFKNVLRGKSNPVWRFKASLKMPGMAYEAAASATVGVGTAGAEDVHRLLGQVKQNQRRGEAAEDLGSLGPLARAALPALREALRDPEPTVRIRVAEALVRIDPAETAAVTALGKLLQDQSPRVRKAAAYALGNLGPDAKAAVPDLIQALDDRDAKVRWTVLETLGQLGAAAEPAVPALIARLKDADSRGVAADALGQIGPAAKQAIPALQAALQDAAPGVRWAAALSLIRIDPMAAKPALPMFVAGLKSNEEKTYWDARWFLTMMGPAAKEAAPAVAERLRAGDTWCAFTLGSIGGPEAAPAVPHLIEKLKGGAGEGDWAVTLLGQIGPTALPALLDVVKNPGGPGRPAALKAIGLIGPQARDAIPLLIDRLKDPDEKVRVKVAELLNTYDPKPREAIPALTESLKDANVWVRLTAAWSLIGIAGPETKAVVPVLTAALNEADHWPRRSAALALAEVSPAAAKEAVPALQARLQDADPGTRVAAARALNALKLLPAKAALPVLAAALPDKDPWTRQHGAGGLGRLGPAAVGAVPALTERLRDDNEDVRKAAAAALELIGKK